MFCSHCIEEVVPSLAPHLKKNASNVARSLGVPPESINWIEHKYEHNPTVIADKLLKSWCESFLQPNVSFDSDSFVQILEKALKEGGREDLVDNLVEFL
jgi:hypothetical protein